MRLLIMLNKFKANYSTFYYSVWQHVDCMGIDRANIPDDYLCEKCQPRRIDKQKAIALQMRKKKEMLDNTDSSSDASSNSDGSEYLHHFMNISHHSCVCACADVYIQKINIKF